MEGHRGGGGGHIFGSCSPHMPSVPFVCSILKIVEKQKEGESLAYKRRNRFDAVFDLFRMIQKYCGVPNPFF